MIKNVLDRPRGSPFSFSLFGPWTVAAVWASARLAFPPAAHNSHTIMYPLVDAAGGYNSLEPFHPLYVPMVRVLRGAWEAGGRLTPALPVMQAVSLLAACAHLLLLATVVRRATGRRDLALGAVLIASATQNLWAWGTMTTSYTLATACLLAAAARALSIERPTLRDAWAVGAWLGLAAGWDTAAAAGLLAFGWDLMRRRAPGDSSTRLWAALIGGFLIPVAFAYALFFRRLGALGWPVHATFASVQASLPPDIQPLWQTLDFRGQWRAWQQSTAPLDAPLWAALATLALSQVGGKDDEKRARLWRLGAGLWLAISAFFFISDPHNRFVYAAGILLPALAAAAFSRARRPLLGCSLLAAALLAWNCLHPPLYAPESNPGLDEAEFLVARLAPGGLILAASDPDWILSYGLGRRVEVVSLSRPGDDFRSFGHRRMPVDTLETQREVDALLCGVFRRGGRAVFAADAMFRSSLLPSRTLDQDVNRFFAGLSRRFAVGPDWISPGGQHYEPLSARRGSCR